MMIMKCMKRPNFQILIFSHYEYSFEQCKIQNIRACNSSSKPIKRQVIQSEIVNREIEEERV